MLTQMGVIKLSLMLVQAVVHFPKFILCSGALCSFRCMLGVRMHLCNGKIAKYETKLVSKTLLYVFDYRISLSAIGTFIIAIFNQSHRRCIRSLGVITLANRQSQLCGFHLCCLRHLRLLYFSFSLLNDSRATRTPLAPGFT